ncbi:hypothetical protein ACKUSY_00325 [Myroides odoratus]
MSLKIIDKSQSTCKKYEFSIYEHALSLEDLDKYILEILYDKDKLNYLFQKDVPLSGKDRLKQLQRFIENSFINREGEINDIEIRNCIHVNKNETYYSFFAEALLARLNVEYIDSELVTGVISTNENLTKISTGADVCMFSDNNLVIGEAKFYNTLNKGTHSIIKDESFKSKLEDYIKNLLSSSSEIILKNIVGDISEKTSEEIKKLPLTLSGFVLHDRNKTGNYNKTYELIDKIAIVGFPSHYRIHLYHLPIESKKELIFKAQRKALDLIIKERSI